DTIAQVATVAKNRHPEAPDFEPISRAYAEDYAAHEAEWSPRINRHAGNGTVTPSLMLDYLDSLRPIEEASLARVSSSKLMAGATRGDFYAAGRLVRFRPGAATAINRFLAMRLPTYVVSVNWSHDFIRGALHANGVVDAEKIAIYCNDPEFDSCTGLCTGWLAPRITVAGDKTKVIRELRRSVEDGDRGDCRSFVVYVGDSLTDLPALLAADLGFIVGSSSSVTSWCQWLGILPQPDPASGTMHFDSHWPCIEKTVVRSVSCKDKKE
ncbi:hypothetical protein LPJ56_003998, partial [Coemansia sp. RSA 2599]